MKKVAMIPARFEASRYPGKLMGNLGGKTVIQRTYENTVASKLFDEVYVVTDSEMIFNEIIENGGNAIMSKKQHTTGSDRIAEAISDLDCDIVVNVQGDEPFVAKEPLRKLLESFDDYNVEVASLMQKMDDIELINDPNNVKVVVDAFNNVLMFSRSVIPYNRDKEIEADYYRHIGIYGFRKPTLLKFTRMEATKLEQIEKLEQLRLLENGIKIRMVETDFVGIGIDTPEDLFRANEYLKELENN